MTKNCRDYVDLIDLTGISSDEVSDGNGSDSEIDVLPEVPVTLSTETTRYSSITSNKQSLLLPPSTPPS